MAGGVAIQIFEKLLALAVGGANIGSFFINTDISKATKALDKSLDDFESAIHDEMAKLRQASGSLLRLDNQINHLCEDLQKWARQCTCGDSSSPNFNLDFVQAAVGLLSRNYQVAAATHPSAQVSHTSLGSNINVEIHNYGEPKGQHGVGSGRDPSVVLGEVIAKDIRRGGPASIAIKHTFGVGRQPVRR